MNEENKKQETKLHRILIVDTNPVRKMILQCYLSECHYHVSMIESGNEALHSINHGRKVDLVILGVRLKEMSGAQLCKKIRSLYPSHEVPVVLFTDTFSLEDSEHFLNMGGNDVLSQNDSKEELVDKINAQLKLLNYYRSLELKGLTDSLIEFRKVD